MQGWRENTSQQYRTSWKLQAKKSTLENSVPVTKQDMPPQQNLQFFWDVILLGKPWVLQIKLLRNQGIPKSLSTFHFHRYLAHMTNSSFMDWFVSSVASRQTVLQQKPCIAQTVPCLTENDLVSPGSLQKFKAVIHSSKEPLCLLRQVQGVLLLNSQRS